jgi:hypothetical protein
MLEKVAADTVSSRGTTAAPVVRLVRDQGCVFGPDVVTRMSEAYHAVLQELRMVDRDDAGTLMVAKHIMELARQGERDVQRLVDATLENLSR